MTMPSKIHRRQRIIWCNFARLPEFVARMTLWYTADVLLTALMQKLTDEVGHYLRYEVNMPMDLSSSELNDILAILEESGLFEECLDNAEVFTREPTPSV